MHGRDREPQGAVGSGFLRGGARQPSRKGGPEGTRDLDPYPRPGPGHRLPRRYGDEPEPLDPVGDVDHARQPARIMVDEDDGGSGRDPFRDGAIQFVAGRGVQAGPCLVQDQEFRFGQEGLGHGDLLAGALGEFRQRRTGVVGGPEPGQPCLRPPGRLGGAQAVDPAQVDEVPGRGEGQRRREALGNVGRTRPAAGDPPLGRGVDPREQPQQG